jgi:hypothetical protein
LLAGPLSLVMPAIAVELEVGDAVPELVDQLLLGRGG